MPNTIKIKGSFIDGEFDLDSGKIDYIVSKHKEVELCICDGMLFTFAEIFPNNDRVTVTDITKFAEEIVHRWNTYNVLTSKITQLSSEIEQLKQKSVN